MQITTDIQFVLPNPRFYESWTANWAVIFTKTNTAKVHTFPAKPTKKQIRKLRREFRKEAI